MDLKVFFDRALRATFADLVLRDDAATEYLADLLTRFARTENLFPPGMVVPRLETVVDMLLETQAVWQGESPSFRPEHEVTVRRHIGDFTLFMIGVFRERVESLSTTGYYIAEGKRAYRFVSEYDRARTLRSRPDGPSLYRRLAERFETYASTLDYARKVYFPGRPVFRFGLP